MYNDDHCSIYSVHTTFQLSAYSGVYQSSVMLYNSLISSIVAYLFLTGTLGKKVIIDTDLFSDVE